MFGSNWQCRSQQQLQESIKLRARVTEAAVERAALLAEINACKASLDAQQVGFRLTAYTDDADADAVGTIQVYERWYDGRAVSAVSQDPRRPFKATDAPYCVEKRPYVYCLQLSHSNT